jgi:hypothetical protein
LDGDGVFFTTLMLNDITYPHSNNKILRLRRSRS